VKYEEKQKENKKEMMYGNASRSATGTASQPKIAKRREFLTLLATWFFGSWLVRSEVGRALTWEKVCFCG